jgi:hypothetical protein
MIVETGFHLKNAADLSSEVGPPLIKLLALFAFFELDHFFLVAVFRF